MPSRRSVLAFLGLAPVAVPAAIAATARREMLVAGVDVAAAGVEVGVFAVTPGALRGYILRDWSRCSFVEMERAAAAFEAAEIPPGSWIPFDAQGEGDA